MSGETEANISGWTTDTLHSHLLARMDDMRDALRQEIDREREFASIRLDDLRAATRSQSDDRIRILDERYATQTKALDAAFKAAEQAVAVALANAEKATAKAEAASNARFESVNEFRKALTDQTATFIPRAEYDAAHAALTDRVTAGAARVDALELRLTSRLDRGEGSDAGAAGQRTDQRLNISQVIAALGFLAAVITLILYVTKK
jgi:hypothetical protein